MTEIPILFSAPMVRALLDGSKTQTRRVVKPQPTDSMGETYDGKIFGPELYEPAGYDKNGEMIPMPEIYGIYDEDGEWGIKSPFGQPGDQIWVKETWRTWASLDNVKPSNLENGVIRDFAAGGNSVGAGLVYDLSKRWRSPLFMQKRFSRIQLEITNVRVERLNDISEADAIAEGIERISGTASVSPWRNYRIGEKGEMSLHCSAPSRSYMTLWESINGAGSWAKNPWVWVIEFNVVKP